MEKGGPIVSEYVLKKQKTSEEWALVKKQELESAKKKKAEQRKLIYNKATQRIMSNSYNSFKEATKKNALGVDPLKVEVRLFDKLFIFENLAKLDDWLGDLNPESKVVISEAYVVPLLRDATVEVEALMIQCPKLGTVMSQVKKFKVSVLVLGHNKPSPLFNCLCLKSSMEEFVEHAFGDDILCLYFFQKSS
ncbi:unnamed protein product [Fraxinus pennsylvanica]|uniref:tRNA synthetases class I (E and Q) anti-codon binding domain-containing protein n=1 Tax=Fraxinus pennsylvanica TaxID=56036 RepID=A0AAD1ZF87_9LAMI|nr:unnamed protein product [Fraxinus pennsylvanica]